MKNPLLDVIRQSNGSERSLSDSGSFDTTENVLGPTANDAAIESVGEEELQLLEATGAIVIDDGTGTVSFEVQESPDEIFNRPLQQTALNDASQSDPGRAPFLARLSPVICIVVAAIAATSWSVYSRMQEYSSASGVGTAELTVPATSSGDVAGTVHVAGAERFPFIDPEAIDVAGDSE